jgi:hypothetical protein
VTDVLDPAQAERLDAVAPDEALRRREGLARTARGGVGLRSRARPAALAVGVRS